MAGTEVEKSGSSGLEKAGGKDETITSVATHINVHFANLAGMHSTDI